LAPCQLIRWYRMLRRWVLPTGCKVVPRGPVLQAVVQLNGYESLISIKCTQHHTATTYFAPAAWAAGHTPIVWETTAPWDNLASFSLALHADPSYKMQCIRCTNPVESSGLVPHQVVWRSNQQLQFHHLYTAVTYGLTLFQIVAPWHRVTCWQCDRLSLPSGPGPQSDWVSDFTEVSVYYSISYS